jgi:hypothetical protein
MRAGEQGPQEEEDSQGQEIDDYIGRCTMQIRINSNDRLQFDKELNRALTFGVNRSYLWGSNGFGGTERQSKTLRNMRSSTTCFPFALSCEELVYVQRNFIVSVLYKKYRVVHMVYADPVRLISQGDESTLFPSPITEKKKPPLLPRFCLTPAKEKAEREMPLPTRCKQTLVRQEFTHATLVIKRQRT